MTKKNLRLWRIVERVKKTKATGVIFNISKTDASMLQNKLLDSKNAIAIRGRSAPNSAQFIFRLSYLLKTKHLKFSMLPCLLDDKIIIITEADLLKSSYSKVIEALHENKIPLLLLMHSDAPMKAFRKLPAYNKVLTIEQDYSNL